MMMAINRVSSLPGGLVWIESEDYARVMGQHDE